MNIPISVNRLTLVASVINLSRNPFHAHFANRWLVTVPPAKKKKTHYSKININCLLKVKFKQGLRL